MRRRPKHSPTVSLETAAPRITRRPSSTNETGSNGPRKPPHRKLNSIRSMTQFRCLNSTTPIRQSKINSSPGEDGVCYEMLKQLPRSTKVIILDLVNRIWKEGTIPIQLETCHRHPHPQAREGCKPAEFISTNRVHRRPL